MTKTGYRLRLARMNDVELEGEWRTKVGYKLAYNACQSLCDEIWFESVDRGLGTAFMGILSELKAERKAEQEAQLLRVQSLGVK